MGVQVLLGSWVILRKVSLFTWLGFGLGRARWSEVQLRTPLLELSTVGGEEERQIAANVDNCDIHSNFLGSPGPISSRFSVLTSSLEFPSPRPLRHSTTTPKARHHWRNEGRNCFRCSVRVELVNLVPLGKTRLLKIKRDNSDLHGSPSSKVHPWVALFQWTTQESPVHCLSTG